MSQLKQRMGGIQYTGYEKAGVIVSRELRISMSAQFILRLAQNYLEKSGYNPMKIWKLESEKGVAPINVKKPYPVINEES